MRADSREGSSHSRFVTGQVTAAAVSLLPDDEEGGLWRKISARLSKVPSCRSQEDHGGAGHH